MNFGIWGNWEAHSQGEGQTVLAIPSVQAATGVGRAVWVAGRNPTTGAVCTCAGAGLEGTETVGRDANTPVSVSTSLST